jgi:hypothetical protein
MKLIMENAVLLDGSIEDELNESSGATERNYYISGIFSTPEAKNRNGRTYSRNIWEREVQKYQDEIKGKTVNTLGEWQHPPRSTVDPLKAVMRITELKINEEGNVWGKAKILNDNTEQTNKLKGLIKEGIKIGVSSRGVGKVSATGVVENFKLITYDAVDMPSDYNAMLNGVVEGYQIVEGIVQNKEFYIDEETGCIGECSLETPAKDAEITEGEKAEKETVFENVEVLRTLLAEKDADKLCDLSLKEKEEVLSKFSQAVRDYESYKIEESNKEAIKIVKESSIDEEKAKELLKAFKSLGYK